MSLNKMVRDRKDVRTKYLKQHKPTFGRYVCPYCYKPTKPKNVDIDHIIPWSKWGTNHSVNLIAACKKCNRSKSDRINVRYLVQGYSFVLFRTVLKNKLVALTVTTLAVLKLTGRI